MRRAGLDYHEYAHVQRYANWQHFTDTTHPDRSRMFALTTRGRADAYATRFQPGDWLVFGSETDGLAPEVREQFAADRQLRLPMREGQRSLNLSNAVAVLVYEAWRQHGFGATKP
jgi:tRNA (cytidine/uridine-2'-O-)-methyltransferase